MEKRYVPNSSFAVMDKKGRKRLFVKDYTRRDGTSGYTEDDVASLYKEHLASFTVIGVDLPEVEIVEAATAAPGEKRTRKPKTVKPSE